MYWKFLFTSCAWPQTIISCIEVGGRIYFNPAETSTLTLSSQLWVYNVTQIYWFTFSVTFQIYGFTFSVTFQIIGSHFQWPFKFNGTFQMYWFTLSVTFGWLGKKVYCTLVNKIKKYKDGRESTSCVNSRSLKVQKQQKYVKGQKSCVAKM